MTRIIGFSLVLQTVKVIYYTSVQVGHVDSGKSTLSGRLLHLLGRISQKQMHKYEKDAKNQVSFGLC